MIRFNVRMHLCAEVRSAERRGNAGDRLTAALFLNWAIYSPIPHRAYDSVMMLLLGYEFVVYHSIAPCFYNSVMQEVESRSLCQC